MGGGSSRAARRSGSTSNTSSDDAACTTLDDELENAFAASTGRQASISGGVLGVSLQALEQLRSQCPAHASTAEVVQRIILPALNGRSSYADTLPANLVGPASVVICHHWSAPYEALVAAVAMELESCAKAVPASDATVPPKASANPSAQSFTHGHEEHNSAVRCLPYVWVDFLCGGHQRTSTSTSDASQGSAPTLQQAEHITELPTNSSGPTTDICKATFDQLRKVLKQARTVLVVLDSRARVLWHMPTVFAAVNALHHHGPGSLRLASSLDPLSWAPITAAYSALTPGATLPKGLPAHQRNFLRCLAPAGRVEDTLIGLQRGLLEAAKLQYHEAVISATECGSASALSSPGDSGYQHQERIHPSTSPARCGLLLETAPAGGDLPSTGAVVYTKQDPKRILSSPKLASGMDVATAQQVQLLLSQPGQCRGFRNHSCLGAEEPPGAWVAHSRCDMDASPVADGVPKGCVWCGVCGTRRTSRAFLEACHRYIALLEADEQYAAAESVARTLYDAALARSGGRSLRTAAALLDVARLQSAQGYYSAAEVPVQQALEVLVPLCGERSQEAALCWAQLAQVKQGLGLHDEAEDCLRRAISVLDTLNGPTHELTQHVSLALGRFLVSRRRYVEAEVHLQASVHAAEDMTAASQQVPMSNGHGHTSSSAEPTASSGSPTAAAAMAAIALGSSSSGVASGGSSQSLPRVVISNLDSSSSRTSDLGCGIQGASQPLCLPMMQLVQWTDAASHLALALLGVETDHDGINPLYESGAMMCGTGHCMASPVPRLRGGVRLSCRALEARQAALGIDHPMTVALALRHALLLSEAGKHDEACATAQDACRRMCSRQGTSHVRSLQSCLDLAMVLSAAGRLHDAEVALQGALDAVAHMDTLHAGAAGAAGSEGAAESVGGDMAAAVAAAAATKGSHSWIGAAGDDTSSGQLQGSRRLSPCTQALLALPGLAQADVRLRELHAAMSVCLTRQGRYAQALHHRVTATALGEIALGAYHEVVVHGYVYAGCLHEALGQLSEAETAFSLAASASTHRFGALSVTTKKVYRHLMGVYTAQGRSLDSDVLMQMYRLGKPRPLLIERDQLLFPITTSTT